MSSLSKGDATVPKDRILLSWDQLRYLGRGLVGSSTDNPRRFLRTWWWKTIESALQNGKRTLEPSFWGDLTEIPANVAPDLRLS